MKILGLMSGSSLDGLDLALADFEWADAAQSSVRYDLIAAETLPFSETWIQRLKDLETQNGLVFAKTHAYFGHYLAELVAQFRAKYPFEVALISSHGHTIWHQPDKAFTVQIGCGAALAALTGVDVACDFRTQDIAIFGQGTPLAPIADRYLFGGYDFYLNIGGIANITCHTDTHKYLAFDTSAANQPLNFLANQLGMEYDKDGAVAASGQVQTALLEKLHQLPFLSETYPKSLSNQWVKGVFTPLVAAFPAPTADLLATVVEHIAIETANAVKMIIEKEKLAAKPRRLFATGGGALNTFLMQRVAEHCKNYQVEVVIPSKDIVQFKEALLMGVLGFLRVHNVPNTIATVTGAQRDTIGGALHKGKKN